jgi:ribosomal protein S18 acetylase RimI-like enzyme
MNFESRNQSSGNLPSLPRLDPGKNVTTEPYVELREALALNGREKAALAVIYKTCFEGPPWFERWTLGAAGGEIEGYVKKGALFSLSRAGGKIAGFAIALALGSYEGGEEIDKYLSRRPSFYIAELAVSPEFRGKSQGRELTAVLKKAGTKLGFGGVSARTRTDNTPALRIFVGLGFRAVGVQIAVTGSVQSERVILEWP